MAKSSDIKIKVTLDDNNVPEKIEWEATESGFEGTKESKTIMMSMWDKEEGSTLAIDLWTKEMTIEEMYLHFHQIMLKMTDTLARSTKNREAADMLENFSREFALKLELDKNVSKG